MAGNQVLFMDPYLVYYPRENRNLCVSPVNGIGRRPDPRWENFRNNLGYLFSPPFSGDAVLYLVDTMGHRQT